MLYSFVPAHSASNSFGRCVFAAAQVVEWTAPGTVDISSLCFGLPGFWRHCQVKTFSLFIGDLDTMAIIAVDTHSDIGLVLAMQTLRLFAVILTGAFVARLVIRLANLRQITV